MSRKYIKKTKKDARKSQKNENPVQPEDMHEEYLGSSDAPSFSSGDDSLNDASKKTTKASSYDASHDDNDEDTGTNTGKDKDESSEKKDSAPFTDKYTADKSTSSESPSPAKDSTPLNTGTLSFGVWLKKQRESKSISLEEVAAVTKVHIYQLKIIEEEQWEQLPAPAFVRGFLVCYAKYLEIDEEEVLRRYRDAMGNKNSTIEAALPAGLKGVRSTTRPAVRVASAPNFQKAPGAKTMDDQTAPLFSPKSIGIALAAVAVVVILITLVSIGKKDTANLNTPAPVPATTTSEQEESKPDEAAQTEEAEPESSASTNDASPKLSKLELIGVEESWINTKVDTGDSSGSTLLKGQVKNFDVKNRVNLILSNAGAVNIRWNGKLYDAPGFRGDVRRLELPKDLAQLKEKRPPPPPPRRETPPSSAPNLPGSAPALPGAPATGATAN